MPNLFGETCLECMRALTSNGVRWSCKPCQRGGSHSMHGNIRVRIVEHWRAEEQLPESIIERIRRAA